VATGGEVTLLQAALRYMEHPYQPAAGDGGVLHSGFSAQNEQARMRMALRPAAVGACGVRMSSPGWRVMLPQYLSPQLWLRAHKPHGVGPSHGPSAGL
jgi:hypothetical protein